MPRRAVWIGRLLACAFVAPNALSSWDGARSPHPAREAPSHSYNVKLYYTGQVPTLFRRDSLAFNGVDQRCVVANPASALVAGQAVLNDRFRVTMMLRIPQDTNPGGQIILAVGGNTRGWGVAYSSAGNIFIATHSAGDATHALGCAFPADGKLRQVDFDLGAATTSIRIDGVQQPVVIAAQGGAPQLGGDVNQAMAIGNRGPGATVVFNRVMEAAANKPAFEAVMGPAADWSDPVGDHWFKGELAYLAVRRGAAIAPQNAWRLDEGAGLPVDSVSSEPFLSHEGAWSNPPNDTFLLHWPLNTLGFDIGSTGALSPPNSPPVGSGFLGIASWSDNGDYGMPVMAEGPIGVALRTQLNSENRHSELYTGLALYNVPAYYFAWTGYIDSAAFTTPGELNGATRLNRFSYGDTPAQDPATLRLSTGVADDERLLMVGLDIENANIQNIIPFDRPYRAIVRYIPSAEGAPMSGTIAISLNAGATWPLSTSHSRPDSFFYRHGWRNVTLDGGRHWIRDLAYGSDLAVVWNAITRTGADLNGDGAVDGADLGLLLGAWGACPEPPVPCFADLNSDAVVNGADLGLFLGAWTGSN